MLPGSWMELKSCGGAARVCCQTEMERNEHSVSDGVSGYTWIWQ